MSTATPEIFLFEGYTLDVVRGCLRAADREIELRPRSFEVLRHLVTNAGRLVTKEELIKTVWPDVIVADESLMQCVSEVRHAIGDSEQRIIRTVPRRGYRLSVPVSQIETHLEPAIPPGVGAVVEKRQIVSGAGRAAEPPLRDRPSIAVLPFANLSDDPQQEYFSDGITADIITELSRFSELLVIARNSTFQYKSRALDVRTIGRELGARYILEGDIRRVGDRVRVNAQLIDAITGAHLWAERYDRELSDVFAVQDEVVRTIVTVLAAHVTKAETGRTLLKPPATWEAYDCYLRGAEAYWNGLSGNTIGYVYEARRLLEKSLSIDPSYARTYAVLARTHVHTYLEPRDHDYLSSTGLDRAHALAQEAVRLDPLLPQAHAQLGWVLVFKRRHEEAVGEFERAISLNPNFNDFSFGLVLAYAVEPARAIDVLRANVRLDPFQPAARLGYLGHAYYMLRRYAEAIPPLRECAARMSIFRIGHLWLAAAYAQSGEFANAQMAAAKVLRIEPEFAIDRWKCTAAYRNPDDAEHLFDGLRKAELPER
jgi:adenylate cyclase